MSIQAIAAAIELRNVAWRNKSLLILLANRHNGDTGQCNPSIARLAQETGQSERTIQRQLKELEDEGLIARRPLYREGRQSTSQFDLIYLTRGDTHVTPGVTPMSPGGCHPCHPEPEVKPTAATAALPAENFWPSPESVAILKGDFPDAEKHMQECVDDFIEWTHRLDRKFVRLEQGFRQSARRFLTRRLSQNTGGSGRRPAPHGLGGAMLDMLDEAGDGGGAGDVAGFDSRTDRDTPPLS